VIRSFRSRSLEAFWTTGSARRLPVPNHGRVRIALLALDQATRPEDLNIPGFHFHGLRGEPRWSVRVTANWRITFGWGDGDAHDVDLEDYH
jgi:proteic killer suppression protein